jgi:hypothetical protein
VEWNIGEAAGALAATCLNRGLTPRQVRHDPRHLEDFQYLLEQMGVELSWPQLTAGGSYHQWASQRPRHSWGQTEDDLPRWPTTAPGAPSPVAPQVRE